MCRHSNREEATAANWTGGYAQGTTQIILDKAPPVGHFVILDQANDTSDTGGLLICDNYGPLPNNSEAITTAG